MEVFLKLQNFLLIHPSHSWKCFATDNRTRAWLSPFPSQSLLLEVTLLGIQQDDTGNILVDIQNSVLITQRKYNGPSIFRHKLEVVFLPGWWFWAFSSPTTLFVEVKYFHSRDGWKIAQTPSVQKEFLFPSNLLIFQISSLLVKNPVITTSISCCSLK